MKMSLKPPALVVVMALTGRVGQSCAQRGMRRGRAETAADSSKVTSFMISSSMIPVPRNTLSPRQPHFTLG